MNGMSGNKCPFSIIQASGACGCRHAEEVVRRGGSEYDCTEAAAHAVCAALVEHLNALALPELGYEDDLTQTPKSVYERILLGGLQGLRQARDPADSDPGTADIWPVVEAAAGEYGDVTQIPAPTVLPAIQACRIRRRQRGRG